MMVMGSAFKIHLCLVLVSLHLNNVLKTRETVANWQQFCKCFNVIEQTLFLLNSNKVKLLVISGVFSLVVSETAGFARCARRYNRYE